jgi:hypothetical protein
MKKTDVQRKLFFLALIMSACVSAGNVMAQQKVDDKELIGVWTMESMQFEGEGKVMLGGDYARVKVYRAGGEYACAEIAKLKSGEFKIVPHEYGTYTFKDGKYTELGREGIVVMVDNNTFKGRWKNCHEVWKKKGNVPTDLINYIVEKCKNDLIKNDKIQLQIKEYFFN